MPDFDKDHAVVLGLLSQQGLVSSPELQRATGRSQASVSRLLEGLASRVLVLGKARATRYGLPKSIRGLAAQQPVCWTGTEGRIQKIGTLSLLTGDTLHVGLQFGKTAVETVTEGVLPWFLAPLRVQGFLGRLHAQRLEQSGLGGNPEQWALESILFSALQLHDPSGAITIGDPQTRTLSFAESPYAHVQASRQALASALDELAASVAQTFPVGSSAGGEQPKFLAVVRSDRDDSARHVLVKFSPPRGTPYGERWHDLLHAEALASETLADHGVSVARSEVVESATRTYLLSERFDRIGATGRRHVVAIGDAHAAFVPDVYSHWAATAAALARQRRLSDVDSERIAALLAFGRLIGNSDMHAGNMGLFVELKDLAKGRFSLAPIYDMLPMRWRPNPLLGEAPDYAPFDVQALATHVGAARPAQDFWDRLSRSERVSRGMTTVAREMGRRVGHMAGS